MGSYAWQLLRWIFSGKEGKKGSMERHQGLRKCIVALTKKENTYWMDAFDHYAKSPTG